jgi:hypothetical protein
MDNYTHVVALMIWISKERELELPYRGAALIYRFLNCDGVPDCVSSSLKWSAKRYINVSDDGKTARALDHHQWVIAEPALSQDSSSYFQIKINQLGGDVGSPYCAVGIVESEINRSIIPDWTRCEKSIMFCNPGPSCNKSWDAVVCSKKKTRKWVDRFKKDDVLTFLYIPFAGKLAVHCKSWTRVSCLKMPRWMRSRSLDSFNVMFAAGMKDDSLTLMSKNAALPNALQKFYDRLTEMPTGYGDMQVDGDGMVDTGSDDDCCCSDSSEDIE